MVLKTNKMFTLLISFLLFFFSVNKTFAKDAFVTVINPVRGSDNWSQANQAPNDFISRFKETKATWLLRPDYFYDTNNTDFIKTNIPNTSEIGIFLEITSSWAKNADIKYNSNQPWYFANNIFLSGYNPKDRIKLIDSAFEKFKNSFGYYPKTVGAWHIDATSAKYLNQKYKVSSFLICADQIATDGYQIQGGGAGIPYIPDKNNLLKPANSPNDKLNAVVVFWALRDPVLAYNTGKSEESLYSLQANDYLQKNLDINYFKKISSYYLNPQTGDFGQATVGIENDYSLVAYGDEFQKQIKVLSDYSFLTTSQFSTWYLNKYNVSPSYIQKNNPSYGQYNPDPYLASKNLQDKLYWNIHPDQDILKNYFPNYFKLFFVLFISILILIYLFKPNFIDFIFISLLSIPFVVPVFRSGQLFNYGLAFFGPNGHDGLWHIALINKLLKSVPPQNPIFSGTTLSGYHWFFDFLAAIFVKITTLSTFDVYFRYLPVLFSLLIGLLIIKLSKTKKIAYYTIFLAFFAGSLGYIFTLLKSGQLGGESLFWAMQSISTLINPPYALSLIFILLGLLSLKNKKYCLAGLIFGLTTGIKIYALILIVGSLIANLIFDFKKEKLKTLLITIVISLLSVLILGFSKTGFPFKFAPLWFAHSLIDSLDKLYFPRLSSLRFNLSQQLLSPKVIVFICIELFLIFIFILGNFGTRLIAIKKIIKDKFSLVFFIILFGLLIPLFFIQKGTAWNTIQFLYYSLFFANFYFAKYLAENKNKAVVIILLIFSIPTTYATLKNYLGNPAPSAILSRELYGLAYLKNQKDGVVLTYPFDKFKKDNIDTPLPMYLYETTAYVSALSDKSVYLEDEMNLEITGFDYQKRRQEALQFFESKNIFQARGFLLNNQIDYIYLVDNQKLPFPENELQVDQILENGHTRIFKVQK